MTATLFTFDTLMTETPLLDLAHIWLRRQKYFLWFITWHRYDRDSQKLCFFLFNFVFFLIFDTHMTETPSEYFKLKYVLRGGIFFTTKSIRKRIYSREGICRKPIFYYIFEQWIFGPNSLKLVITCQNSNFTTSKTKFYHIFSDQSQSMTHNVVKLSFRCGKIWVLTRDH